MSDYTNYAVSDASDEDSFGYVYYDDSFYDDDDIYYDDVIEFDFDEERRMFEFSPVENSDSIVMTYQALAQLAEMTVSLLDAWKRRSEQSVHEYKDYESSDRIECLKVGLNLYQMERKDRDELRAYSVWKIEKLLGGNGKVLELKRQVGKIVNFVKNVMMRILSTCLPCSLPYPVMNLILSHLLCEEGVAKIGQVAVEEGIKVEEIRNMDELYNAMAYMFYDFQYIMFIPNLLLEIEPSLFEKKVKLIEKFHLLESSVGSTQLELGFEELEIETDDEAEGK